MFLVINRMVKIGCSWYSQHIALVEEDLPGNELDESAPPISWQRNPTVGASGLLLVLSVQWVAT